MQPVRSIHQTILQARQAEKEGDWETAIELYQLVLKIDDRHEHSYDRLMVLYRKLQWYKEELQVIDAGIRAFAPAKAPGRSAKAKKVAELSKVLMQSTGLADKKGNLLTDPEPVARWKKRKTVVQQKLEKQ